MPTPKNTLGREPKHTLFDQIPSIFEQQVYGILRRFPW